MKLARVQTKEKGICYAELRGENYFAVEGDLFGGFDSTEKPYTIQRVLAPIEPTCIFAIGLNYRQHAIEMDQPIPEYPVVTMKNPASILSPGSAIEIPTHLPSEMVDYECELAVVIKRTCKNVKKEEALDYVLGYTCANDVSARDWQKIYSGGQWCKGKSFDTFCPLGPVLVTPESIPNPNRLGIRTILNGEVRQESNTADLIFSVETLIEFLSGSTTLLAGTVILTGTPSGVGAARKPQEFLKSGDQVTIEIDKIGALRNNVIRERSTK